MNMTSAANFPGASISASASRDRAGARASARFDGRQSNLFGTAGLAGFREGKRRERRAPLAQVSYHPQSRSHIGAPAAQRTFHILAQVFAVLILVATASAQSPAALPPGSIAWWPGNTNANDFIGTNHASLHGEATIVPGGKVGGAFSFSGSGYVLLPANIFPLPPTATNNAPFSFETWFKTSGSGVILGQQGSHPANPPSRPDGTMLPMYVGTDGKLRCMLFWFGVQAVSSNAVSDNVWHHVGVTFDGNIEAAYLDGQLFSSVTFTQQPYASFIYYQLGYGFADSAWAGWGGTSGNGGFPFGSWGFSGLIDEPTIYNRALSAAEIQSIYSAGSAGKTPVPVILEHPANQLAPLESDATFSVLAVANPPSPLFYRWWFNHTNEIVGQTNHSLVITNVTLGHAGLYSVEVSNVTGSVVSETAILTVFDPDDPTTRPPGDQLTYLQKYLYGLDPLTPDTDGDGLPDYDELFVHGTNPLLADTDGDGMPDGWEIQHGLNPRFNDAADDLDGDGLSNLAEYQWNLAHGGALDPRNRFSTSATRSDFAVVSGAGTNRFYYDRTDRLVGAEYDRGLSLAYVYDGNGNLTRQVALRHDANANGLPDLWEFLHGLTNNASAHTDSDGDGWTDWQEWKAGTNPRDPASTPNLLGNPGTQIASLQHAFTPSNFVVGVGQLDGVGAEEIVLGADGNPGTNVNHLLVLTQSPTGWQTQRVDVGAFGITSIAVGQVTNRPGPGIYVGLRGTTNGSGRVMELLNTGGVWQSNVVALATNEAAFVLGVRGRDVLVSAATSTFADGSMQVAGFSTNWNLVLIDVEVSHRGLGTMGRNWQSTLGLRLLDGGGVQVGGGGLLASTLDDGLTAHYALNGDATDSSANGKHGTIINAIPTQNRFGAPHSALRFNGSNSYVRVIAPLAPGNEFSWTAWFRPGYSATNVMACLMNNGGNPGAQAISPAVFLNKAGGLGRVDFYTWDGQERHLYSQVRLMWDTNQWYNVVITYEAGGTKKLFINGVLENSASNLIGDYTPPNFYIGASPAYSEGFFFGDMDDVRHYNRALTAQEITNSFMAEEGSVTMDEPSASKRIVWRGLSLASGYIRTPGSSSVFYTFTDDLNANGVVDFADDFVTAEYLVSGTNATLLTLSRQSIAALNPAQSYGLASMNFLGGSNEVFFTGEPDGQVFAWTATGATNPLQRQLFSAHHAGKGWHALAGVKTLDAGEALIGLRVDPASPQRCDVILWPPQTQLPALANLPNTLPAAAVLPSAGTLGGQAAVTVRLWDAEGNAATPFLQFQLSGTTNWQDATLTGLNGGPYSVATRVAASPAGQNHAVVWNALADLGADTVTNVLLRARARDMTSLGDWSVGTPFAVNTVFPGNVGNEPAFGPAQRLADGRFQLSVTGGQLGQSYVLLASTNLADWIPIHGYVFTNPPITIIDPDAASFRWRFYRIGPPVSLPAGTLAVGGVPSFSGSGANLLLYVTPGVNYQIEASTDLVHWTALTNFMGTVSPFPFHDPAATNFDRRFYRVVRP